MNRIHFVSVLCIGLFPLMVLAVYGQSIDDNVTNADSPRDSPTGFDWLASLTEAGNFLALLGIFSTFALYFYTKQKEKRDLKKNAYKTIDWELKDIEESFSKHQKVSYITQDQKNVNYTNAHLYDEAYSSLVNSGSFVQLHANLQYALAELYARIRRRNEVLTYLDELQDDMTQNDEKKFFQIVERYDLILTRWEKEIKEIIPKIRELM